MTSPSSGLKKLLKVALVGAPNAGKSTLLNRLIGADVSTVSRKAHTTKKNIRGVLTHNDTQIEFYDSPGVVTRTHLIRHRLESSHYDHPLVACQNSNLIAVMIDVSNIREQKRLNKGILSMLHQHSENCKSILIMNKVDAFKDKRKLLDIGHRLTQGCLEGKKIAEGPGMSIARLESEQVGYKNFSQVHSISALNNDGVTKLRDSLIEFASIVDQWPHGPDYVSNSRMDDIVHSILRGKIMDYVDRHVPYLVKFRYLSLAFDELSSLNVNLQIVCPERYMIAKVLGKSGINITRIVDESRDSISKNLACDVKLNIEVVGPKKKENFNSQFNKTRPHHKQERDEIQSIP